MLDYANQMLLEMKWYHEDGKLFKLNAQDIQAVEWLIKEVQRLQQENDQLKLEKKEG